MIRPSHFLIGRDTVKTLFAKPITSKLLGVNEKVLSVIPRPLTTVGPGEIAIIDNKIVVNNSDSALTVPDPMTYENTLLAGFSAFEGSPSKENENSVDVGDTIPSGETRFIDGKFYSNPGPDDIIIPADTTEVNLLAIGLVRYEGSGDEELLQSYVDNAFFND